MRKNLPKQNSDAFDIFLEKKFSVLKNELDETIQKHQSTKEKKAIAFKPDIPRYQKRRPFLYGIAALVLVGVTIPILVELNYEKQKFNTSDNATIPSAVDIENESTSPTKREAKNKKKQVPARKGIENPEATEPKTEKEAPPLNRRESPRRDNTADAVDATPAAASAEEFAKAAPPQRAREEAAAPKPYDAGAVMPSEPNLKISPKEISQIEKNEMEKLWREFKSNPTAFKKNAAKVKQLRVLLKRYDTKRLKELEQ